MKILKIFEIQKNGRKLAKYQDDDGSIRYRSYPRFLLEEKLGRPLLPEETVDHIDGDFKNDSPDNLRPLSRSENSSWAWKTGNCKPFPMSDENKTMHKNRMSGTKNILAKFSDEQIAELRKKERYHGCITDLSKEYGVTIKTMSNILNNKTYK